MTNISANNNDINMSADTPKERMRQRLKARYRAEMRFKLYGLGAIIIAAIALVILVQSILIQAIPAFTAHSMILDIDMAEHNIDPELANDVKQVNKIDFRKIINNSVYSFLPDMTSRKQKKDLRQILSASAPFELKKSVMENPDIIEGQFKRDYLLDDVSDLYFKGYISEFRRLTGQSDIQLEMENNSYSVLNIKQANKMVIREILATSLSQERDAVKRLLDLNVNTLKRVQDEINSFSENSSASNIERNEKNKISLQQLEAKGKQLQSQLEGLNLLIKDESEAINLSSKMPSIFIKTGDIFLKLSQFGANKLVFNSSTKLSVPTRIEAGNWQIFVIEKPEDIRLVSDQQAIMLERLNDLGIIHKHFNWHFFQGGDSTNPEYAAIAAAFKGSLLLLVVTLCLSFPLGVCAAVYLEEFAPKNQITDFIEVNINNLAAVPSIIFGLFGLAIFHGAFGIERGTALIGGMVLALMTMPTIIIASRASLRAVPPSIREAALGLGASRLQTVTHHVLPLALPGMMTGTIIGMAQALGETAPLILIGLIAFIVDIPGGFTDASTALPSLIYKWGDQAFLAFQHKTAAAIVCLLIFLIFMNAMAVILRKKFERRW